MRRRPRRRWSMSSRARAGCVDGTFRSFERLEDRSLLAAIAWDGGGLNSDWNNPLNWSLNRVPNAADDVTIETGATLGVVHSSGTTSIRSLSTDETISITGGSISISAASTIQAGGQLIVSNAAFGGAGQLTNRGTIDLRAATIDPPIVNQGRIVSKSLSRINGALSTTATSVIESLGTNTIGSSQLEIAAGFTNLGRIELNTSGSAVEAHLRVLSGTLVNASGAEIASLVGAGGARVLHGGIENRGLLDVQQTLFVGSNTPVLDSTLGTIRLAASQSIESSSPRIVVTPSGLTGPGTLHLFGTTLVIASGNLVLQPGGPQLLLDFARVEGPGTLTNRGVLELDRDTIAAPMVNEGELRIATSADFAGGLTSHGDSIIRLGNTSSSSRADIAGNFTNNGSIVIAPGAALTESRFHVNGGTFTNASDSEIVVLPGGGGPAVIVGPLVNNGRIDARQSLGLSAAGSAIANSGILQVAPGVIVTIGDGTFTSASTGTLTEGTYDLAGKFRYGGTNLTRIAANVTLDGPTSGIENALGVDRLAGLTSIAPTGSLALTGGRDLAVLGDFSNEGVLTLGAGSDASTGDDFDQSPSGRLELEIAATGIGRVLPLDSATLGGTLEVQLDSSFTPATATQFAVLGYASATADFTAFEGLRRGSSLQLRPRREATSYTLTVEANQAPDATPDVSTTPSGVATPPIDVLANDLDLDPLPGETLALQSFTQGSNGTVTLFAPGQLVYTPSPGFIGVDAFNYVIRDEGGLTASGVVTVTVTPSGSGNDPQSIVDQLNAGFAATMPKLPTFAARFDLGGQSADALPLVTDDPNTLFDLESRAGEFTAPTLAAANTQEQLIGVLDAAGAVRQRQPRRQPGYDVRLRWAVAR